MKAIAIDIGGSHAGCAIVEDAQTLAVECVRIDDASTLGPLLTIISTTIRRLLCQCSLEARACEGVAVSFPGIVDSGTGRVLSTPRNKYSDAATIDLNCWALSEYGLPLRIENDARMALLGERYAGVARGIDDVVMVTLGTGFGAAAMMEGHLLRGKHFQGGCIGGHLLARFNGRRCICGNLGCIEAEASTWALPQICAAWPNFEQSRLAAEPMLNFQTLSHFSSLGDPVASEIEHYCVLVWSAGIVGLIHAYDPELVVLGGSVIKSPYRIVEAIQTYVDCHAWTHWGKVQIRPSALQDAAALLGAIPLLRSGTIARTS